MRRTLFVVTLLLVLGGCATHSEPKPAVCDGKHRRPANLYGSVLPSIPGTGTAAPQPVAPEKPVSPTKPGPQSSIDPQSFDPCGRAA